MRSLISSLLLITLIALAPLQAPAPLSVHGPLPTGAPERNQLITGHLYTASIDPDTKVATWCAYVVTPGQFEGSNSLSRNWINGKGRLADVCLEHQDYAGSGYDMGHLVPLASFSSTRWAYECNFLGVIAPQTPNLNRGPWLRVETLVRRMAEDHARVNVCVGGLYEKAMPKLIDADEDHKVPSHYWAVLRYDDQVRVYIIPQDCPQSVESLDQFSSTLEALMLRSKLGF